MAGRRPMPGTCQTAPSHPGARPEIPHVKKRHLQRPYGMGLCDDFCLFFDGEMDKERAMAFRLHLADCSTCQDLLTVAMLVEAHIQSRMTWWKRLRAWVRRL